MARSRFDLGPDLRAAIVDGMAEAIWEFVRPRGASGVRSLALRTALMRAAVDLRDLYESGNDTTLREMLESANRIAHEDGDTAFLPFNYGKLLVRVAMGASLFAPINQAYAVPRFTASIEGDELVWKGTAGKRPTGGVTGFTVRRRNASLRLSPADAIFRALDLSRQGEGDEGWMTRDGIAQELQLSPDDVDRALARLTREGRVQSRTTRGRLVGGDKAPARTYYSTVEIPDDDD